MGLYLNIIKNLPKDINLHIFKFLQKKCEYCNKYNFEFDMKNILYSSHYFFFEKKKQIYVYKCIEC